MATHSSIVAWRIPGMGAWWAAVYGVAQSRTRLMWLSCSSLCGEAGQLPLCALISQLLAVITRYCRPGSLSNRIYFLRILEARSLRSRCGQILLRPFSLLCRWLLCVSSRGLPSGPACLHISSYKDTSCTGLGSSHWPNFNLTTSLKDPVCTHRS